MKASAETLQGVIDLLPLTLARRYDKLTFGVRVANEVLSEIEEVCDPDLFTGESGLVLISGVTDYLLPDSVRQIKGLYQVPGGGVVPDRSHPVLHRFMNDKIRLEEELTLSDDEDITGTVSASPPASKRTVYDTVNLGSDLDEDELTGRMIALTHAADSSIEYKILKGNTPDDSVADINGELSTLALAGDTFLITSNFLIIEHLRYLRRFVSGSTAGVLDLPQDFNYLFRCGLFVKYHSQADNLSKETNYWLEQYTEQLNLFRIDTTKHRGTATRNPGRSLPKIF